MPSSNTAAIEADDDVMAAIDRTSAGERYVIADVTCDDAWLSTRYADATSLSEWC
ncbi:MAG: hypothetical protein ABEJ74_01225 [Haloferacaceae archaeon]